MPTTLITGAAIRIGAEIARHLAAQGHDLVLHYRQSEAEAESLAAELRATRHAPRITLKQADLQDTAALLGFWSGLPPVNHFIHNASRYTRDTLASMTVQDLHAHLMVNFQAPLILTQGFMKQLPSQTQGNIVVLGDDALGWSISPEFFSYSISKHAWRSAIDLLAASIAPRARANVIALAATMPGVIDGEAMFARLAQRAPLKRNNMVEEVLRALDFVLASSGLTGQVIGLGNGMGLATARPN